jgi:hypothetical protein
MIYDGADIMNIGEAGLEFVDEYGDVRFVSFEVCSTQTRQQGHPPTQIGRRVLVIDSLGQVTRTVEFFTPTPTVFRLDSDADYQRLRFRLEQVGWQLA